jgi:hypothetical protein
MLLLLLAFVVDLSLIFHSDIDDHPSSATQSRDPNTLKVEYGVVNSGTLDQLVVFHFL